MSLDVEAQVELLAYFAGQLENDINQLGSLRAGRAGGPA
jgi:hypothetical protein